VSHCMFHKYLHLHFSFTFVLSFRATAVKQSTACAISMNNWVSSFVPTCYICAS
jgi:hypothetical protein